MNKDLAAANVGRSYSLAGTSIGIFTFVLFFLYPMSARGDADARLFQAALAVMGLAIFSFAFASFHYYSASLGERPSDPAQTRSFGLGDRCWMLGCILLFFAPGLVLFSIGLLIVSSIWLALWLGYVLFVIRSFPRLQMAWKAKENQ